MANFCISRLSCEKEILDNIVKNYITNGNFDFNAIIPAEGNDDRSEKWGTKWYPEDVKRENENTIRFSNPWSPPEPIIHKLAELYEGHEFRIEYHDEVHEFSGEEHIKYEENTLKRKGWFSDSDGKQEFSSEHYVEDAWIKKEDHLPSYLGGKILPYEKLIHTFGDTTDTTVSFSVHPSSLHDQETTIAFGWEEFKGKEGDFRSKVIDINGSIDTAKNLVYNVIKHFDQAQDIRMSDISLYLESKNRDLLQGAEFSSPQDFMDTVQLAKKAAYVQGVCECVAAVGDGYAFGKKLLSEMNVTKEMAEKFANPETYKILEQGIFAPRHEQKQEQTHNFKR